MKSEYAPHTKCPECGLLFTPEAHDDLIKNLVDENARLLEALEFAVSAADYLYKTKSPVPRGLAPMFYHSLSYEGDVELVEKTKKARAALEGKE